MYILSPSSTCNYDLKCQMRSTSKNTVSSCHLTIKISRGESIGSCYKISKVLLASKKNKKKETAMAER